MFQAVGLFLILTLSTSLTNGERITYQVLKMTDAEPYYQKCPESCPNILDTGLKMVSLAFDSIFKTIPFPTDICTCQLEGLNDFSYTDECFISPEKDIVDRYLELTLPHLGGSCECDLPNNPSKLADKINSARTVEGKCGKDNYKNTLHPKPLECKGSQDGDGDSQVSLQLDLAGAEIRIRIRVDNNNVTKYDAFPILMDLITVNPVQITHEGPPEFDEAWKCLAENMDNFFSHVAETSLVPFFECLDETKDANFLNALINSFGKC